MKIILSGTHGTGKTTLLNALKTQTKLNEIFDFVSEVTRNLNKEDGVVINEDGDDYSQYKIALKNYFIYESKKNYISDRSLLDVACYTKYLFDHEKCSKDCLKFVENLFLQCKYDIIFYLEPEFELISDGVRSLNLEFRDEVLENFQYYIKRFDIPVVKINGDINNRVDIVKENLKNKFNLIIN